MKKLIAFLIGMLMCITPVLGADVCDKWVSASTDCVVITPVLECGSYTYDLYNSTYDLVTDDGTMTEIGSSATYNFTFNQADSGAHLIVLCDNSTATINVGLDEVNATDIPSVSATTNNTAIAEAVWNDSVVAEGSRTVNATTVVGNVSINETAVAEEVWEFNVTQYSGSAWVDAAGWFLYWILTLLPI
jgi:hypothetical protein